ncbi:MAG TPA: cytochrome b/b6 domain-containing protein [Gammaproteobacteria bacterium]|nr:cytochrome b/b6 domain-containing protein [Gammaproteobacteria bacterium]
MTEAVKLDIPTRVLHFGVAFFGTWAWWIGEDAGDYHKPLHPNYTLHECVGLTFGAVLALRLLYGFFGPKSQRFSAWMPYTRERFARVKEDLRLLLRFKMPEPAIHRGLNAAVQSLGLLLFTWQAICGTVLSLYIIPGTRAVGWLHTLKELHQTASVWIPTYLALHIGATVLHALTGRQIWKKMVFME